MKTTKLFASIALAAIFLSGCKKDSVEKIEDPVTVNADGTVNVANDAAGACYTIISKTYDSYNGADFQEDHMATAWFGSALNVKNAGVVKANGEELETTGVSGYDWYFSMTFGSALFGTSNSVNWNIQGNASNGIAAFTHTDNTAFPSGASFILPATININNSFTLANANPGNATAVAYMLIGNNGTVTKTIMGASTSITFTSAELKQAAFASDAIGFSVMPLTISNATYNGKKYYFVKQYQQSRETMTQ